VLEQSNYRYFAVDNDRKIYSTRSLSWHLSCQFRQKHMN